MADVPMLVTSDYSSSERRITPSWSISQLKTKLEPITGIPPSCQLVSLRASTTSGTVPVSAADEDATLLESFNLTPYAELHVADTRPAAARPNFSNDTGVERYVMSEEDYEKKTDSVLAWKKAQKLGRFDPSAPDREEARLAALHQEVLSRGIAVGKRCRVGGDDARRGEIMYVGEVKEIPGLAAGSPAVTGPWVGVHLDEPVGKNDGSIAGTRYWGVESTLKHGLLVRPDKVDVGNFPVLDDLEDMEEI